MAGFSSNFCRINSQCRQGFEDDEGGLNIAKHDAKLVLFTEGKHGGQDTVADQPEGPKSMGKNDKE